MNSGYQYQRQMKLSGDKAEIKGNYDAQRLLDYRLDSDKMTNTSSRKQRREGSTSILK